MNRYLRILIAAGLLVLVVAGTALGGGDKGSKHANHPAAAGKDHRSGSEAETKDSEAISDKLVDRLVAALTDAGVAVDAAALREWAAKYGVGGAVRLLAWADAAGKTPGEIAAMFDSGMGWGEIARSLMDGDSSLDLTPGIGWLMSGGHAHKGGSAAAHP